MTPPRALVACEESGRVRDQLRARGIDAISCDLLPTAVPGPHYRGDVFDVIGEAWDALIMFPPCDHLASSGARWFAEKRADGRQAAGLQFVRDLWAASAHIPLRAMENPVGILSTQFRKPTQIIHPWQHGHPEKKQTCLWLDGLPPLVETHNVEALMLTLPKNESERVHRMPPGPNRAKLRSRTYPGVAAAMADQWAPVIFEAARAAA